MFRLKKYFYTKTQLIMKIFLTCLIIKTVWDFFLSVVSAADFISDFEVL